MQNYFTSNNLYNIQNTTLVEVLQSEVYQNLVQNYKKIELCKTCNMRKPI